MVAVIVLAFVLLSGGDDEGGATVDGAAIAVGEKPVDLVFANGELWVTNRVGGSVSVVNPDEPTESSAPSRWAASRRASPPPRASSSSRTASGDSLLQIDDGGEVVDEIETDVDPGGIAVDEEALWVANNGSDTVSRIEGPDHPRALAWAGSRSASRPAPGPSG